MAVPRAVLAAVMVALASACAPALNWRTVIVAEDLTALFPCRVERRARDGVALAGWRVPIEQVACTTAGSTFAVSRLRLGPGQDPDAVLSAWIEAARLNVDGVVSERGVRRLRVVGPSTGGGGVEARQLGVTGRLPDGSAVRHDMVLWVARGAVVQAAVVGAAADSALETFFDGIEIKR